eukprot:Gregarina_sp_Pseudo_9__5842@NODE_8_length_7001_cov_28_146941_g6_i0_p4_GENE_NODE_8_length_7001_cov_28_146941_g6_i0NODE_8_length_7001_cov_28_146941_g6_i0_p4_ORF_typecomplete_len310_score65_40_NODE_8_length_7001_cov_28_146941_g6_i028633792
MGCIQSAAPPPTPAPRAAAAPSPQPPPPTAKDEMPSYMTADPDLGWRNTTEAREFYPTVGFEVDFQNERSGNVLKKLNLFVLSINIAERASKLANRYGVTDSEGFQSSSNLLEDLARQQARGNDENAWGGDVDKDMRKVLKSFGCPHFGWQLLARRFPTAPLMKESPEVFLSGDAPPVTESREELGQNPGREILSELAAVPPFLQEVSDGDKKKYLLDISEIAINIAEQLFRLEKSETAGHRIPNESFGWKLMKNAAMSAPTLPGRQTRDSFAVPVANAEGEALMVIPEELVMHVASWVQQTYLTAPAF